MHNYSKISNTYPYEFLTYLTDWCRFFTLATTPSNQKKLTNIESSASSVSSKDSKRSLILSHFTQIGSDNTNMIRPVCNHCKKEPSTETPTTETTTVRCHKNSWIYSTSTHHWWLLRPMTYDNHSIRFKMKKHYSHSTNSDLPSSCYYSYLIVFWLPCYACLQLVTVIG